GGTSMGSQRFIPRDYDIFSGLDVDKRSISVTFTDHQGLVKSLRMPYSVEHLLNHVRKHFPNQKVAFGYEAGPTGYGLYDGIVAQSHPCLMAAPSSIVKGKLRKLSCSGATRFKLDQLLDSLEFNEKQILKTTREIRRFLNNDAELSQCMKYLMTIPGVGSIVASQLLARIGDCLRGTGGFKF